MKYVSPLLGGRLFGVGSHHVEYLCSCPGEGALLYTQFEPVMIYLGFAEEKLIDDEGPGVDYAREREKVRVAE